MGLIELLLPPDSLRHYVRMVLGLLVIIALVRPIIHELPAWRSWEPALKSASTIGLDRIIATGESIKKKGDRAASEVIMDNGDPGGLLGQRLPDVPVTRIEKASGRLRVILSQKAAADAEKRVKRTLSELGWNKNSIEVIRDAP
jgi:hypothetical protein